MVAVVGMLLVVIFSGDPTLLPNFYYRLLAAIGIVDATLSISAIIMHKLYAQKHPVAVPNNAQTPAPQPKSFWKNPLVVILLLFLGMQLVGGLITLLMSFNSSY